MDNGPGTPALQLDYWKRGLKHEPWEKWGEDTDRGVQRQKLGH